MFDGDWKTQPRISFIGANVNVYFNQIANKNKSYDTLVENVSIAHCLDFVNEVAITVATNFIFNAFIRKISQRNINFLSEVRNTNLRRNSNRK